ncbi:MAG: hypothetical protein V3S10_03630, partial [Dehalococcoidales bacterium]
AFNSLQARESVGQRLLSRKTVGRLTDIAQGLASDAGSGSAAPKERKSGTARPKNARAKQEEQT